MVMILLSVVLLIRPSEHATTWPSWRNFGKIAVTSVAILAYSLVIREVGFIISASLLMAVCMWVLEAERKWIAPISLATATGFYLVFDRLLGLNLPTGVLGFP